jgi:hypothetical protein
MIFKGKIARDIGKSFPVLKRAWEISPMLMVFRGTIWGFILFLFNSVLGYDPHKVVYNLMVVFCLFVF